MLQIKSLINLVLVPVLLAVGCRTIETNSKIEELDLKGLGKIRYVSGDFDKDGKKDIGLFKEDLEVIFNGEGFSEYFSRSYKNKGGPEIFIVEKKDGEFTPYKN